MAHGATFTRPLTQGSTGSDVSALQQILVDQGYLSSDSVTGYFGPLTLHAVAQFQRAHGLDGLGYVGPATRGLLNQFGSDISTSTSASTKPTDTSTSGIVVVRSLGIGSEGSDVSALQTFLQSLGYYSYTEITGYFGRITAAAVSAFQFANGLESVGSVGPLTRTLLRTWGGASATTGSAPTIAGAQSTTTSQLNTAPLPGYQPGQIIFVGGSASTTANSGEALDTTPPTVSLFGPTGQVLADLSQTLTASTSEDAICAYATSPNQPFNSMTQFATTGATTHSTILWNIPYGSSPTYYVKCKDGAGDVSNEVSDSFSTYQFPLQTTLFSFAYYSPEIPFKDLMFQSNRWQTINNGGTCNSSGITVDADGYPTSSLTGTNCAYYTWLMLHIPQGSSLPPGAQYPWPAGHYVLTYDGSGTITFFNGIATNVNYVAPGRIEFDVTNPRDLMTINITATVPGNYLHNVHVFLASDESTYQTQPFQQAFLNELSPYSILRFMDWSNAWQAWLAPANTTNGQAYWTTGISQSDAYHVVLPSTASSADDAYTGDVAILGVSGQYPRVMVSGYNGATRTLTFATPVSIGTLSMVEIEEFPNKTWDSRSSTDPMQQQTNAGVAWEYMIKLANITGKNLWINIPTAADDNYITQLATLLKNELNPNIKVYIEYSNETWNSSYSGYNYSCAQTAVLGLTPSCDAFQAYRGLQIFHIFDQIFGQPDLRSARDTATSTDRLVRILSSQTASVSRFNSVLDWTIPGNAAPTYGLPASDYVDAAAATDYFGLPAGVVASTTPNDLLLSYQKQMIDQNTASSGSGNYDYLLAQAAQSRGLKLVQYEGGEGLTVPDNNPIAIAKLTNMMRDPAMRAVYSKSLYNWQQLSQEFPGFIGAWAQFQDVGYPSQYGFWGMLESVMQNPNGVPRYQALLDFINNSLSIDSTPPSAPAGLTAVASSSPGEIDLSWSPSADNIGLRNYNIFRDGINIGSTTQTTYQDTGLAYSTSYSYVVKAVDTSVNFSASSTVATATTNGPDTTPPQVGWVSPSNTAAVSGTNVRLIATSTDNIGVTKMYFYVDGVNISSAATSSPYTYAWDSTGTSGGTHTLYAVAADAAGNYATTSISVTVDNTTTPSSNLVGYWPFDASTTNWTTGLTLDESGQGNNGQLVHLSTTTAPIVGAVGQALQFNMDNYPPSTSNGEYVLLASTSATSINTNFTVSMWVQPATSSSCCEILIHKSNQFSYAKALYYMQLTQSGGSFSLQFNVGDGSSTVSLSRSFGAAASFVNKWMHFLCSTDTSIMSCYLNGTLLGTTSRATIGPTFTGDNWFDIGTGGSNQFYFFGGIDDVRIYNRVLTPAQILQLYNQGQ